jgi:hypothetical protein
MNSITDRNGSLCGHSVLIIETNISSATDLQDALAETGARIWTAYTFERAYRHAEKSQLSAVIINTALSPMETKLLRIMLAERNIPFVEPRIEGTLASGHSSSNRGNTVDHVINLLHSISGNGAMNNMSAEMRGSPTASMRIEHNNR